jgi:UDP-N-acetylmuramyl pentapeptide synthase
MPVQSHAIAMVKNSETALAVAHNLGLGVADLAEALKNLSEED